MPASKSAAWPAYDVVRTVVAGILLIAALLKGYQLSTEPVLANSFYESRWFLIGVVEFEFALAVWLLAGFNAKVGWRVAVICFAGFSAVSLYKGLSGAASCGCFGPVPVNPWLTSLIDLTVFASLVRWRPNSGITGRTRFESRKRLTGATLVLSLIAIIPMGSYRAVSLSGEGALASVGDLMILEPDEWIGKKFPLLQYVDDSSLMSEGEWVVLLFHHDCSKCQNSLPGYERLAQNVADGGKHKQVLLLEVPPYGHKAEDMGSLCHRRRLRDGFRWFVQTPVEIALKNGITIGVRVSDDITGMGPERRVNQLLASSQASACLHSYGGWIVHPDGRNPILRTPKR